MLGGSRKLLIIALFTVVLIALVNLAWWLFYERTEDMLEAQLARRLAAIAKTTAVPITPEMTTGLAAGDFDLYMDVIDILAASRQADSLSEMFVLAPDYSYLATTSIQSDSLYFLAEINAPYIDSVLFGSGERAVTTPSYKTGSLYLKSAFVALTDVTGEISAVLGVEANVDYFDSLADLRQNLYYSTAMSILGGLLFGILFLLVQRRLNQVQQTLFVNETHAYLGRMVAVVAHEVRNPLMIIRASAERIRKKHQAVEGEFIVGEVDRLNKLVTGYLDVARGGAGESLLKTEKLETTTVGQLVANLEKHFRDKYAGQEVTWLGGDSDSKANITTYLGPLRQVLLNLLINGAEACQSAQKPIAVGLRINSTVGRFTATAIDRGPGMSRSLRKRAGDLFFSTKHTGSGLGLYLSRKIIDEMGGRIDIESTIGSGTKVSITLPQVEPEI